MKTEKITKYSLLKEKETKKMKINLMIMMIKKIKKIISKSKRKIQKQHLNNQQNRKDKRIHGKELELKKMNLRYNIIIKI